MSSAESVVDREHPIATSTPLSSWMMLVRHHLRLLAPSSIIWVIGLISTSMLVVGVWIDTFPTEAERIALAASVEGNPAFEAMFGRAVALETIEGFTMWRAGGPLVPAIVIWGMLAATRLARAEEDKGHDELLLGGVLSRKALLISALLSLALVISVFTGLMLLGLQAVSDISGAGAARYAFAMTGAFAFFAALGALLAQITSSRTVALRLGLGLVGLALGARILSILEQMPGWFHWITPFGWFQEVGTPEVGSNAPFILFGGGAFALAVASIVLSGRREINGSILFTGSEDAGTGRPLRSLWDHEVRQNLPALVGFSAVGLFMSALFGMVATDFTEFIQEFPAFAEFLAEFGLADPTDPAAYIGLVITLLVLIPALYAAGHIASGREDEASGRLTVLLVLPLERHRWLFVNTVVGLAAVVIISLVVGLGAMIGTAITGTMLDPLDALRAGLNLMPISVMFIGLGILVFGIYPPLTGPLVYTFMLTTFLLVLMDAFLDIPGWVISMSPFEHLALVPGEDADLVASAVFLLIGVSAGIAGAILFRRRDLMMD